MTWDLHWVHDVEARPLFTFPAWASRRDVLPAVAISPVPDAQFVGSIGVDGVARVLSPFAPRRRGPHLRPRERRAVGMARAGLGDGDVLEQPGGANAPGAAGGANEARRGGSAGHSG